MLPAEITAVERQLAFCRRNLNMAQTGLISQSSARTQLRISLSVLEHLGERRDLDSLHRQARQLVFDEIIGYMEEQGWIFGH